ncbi:MAG: heme exporter protein CcmB [Nitrospirae bacterium]|nr:heme exporter protein CcmB [Candidatus Troglogloeales bacterium]
MPFFDVIKWIVWKDILSEIRSRESISSLFFFALNVILIFSFSFSVDRDVTLALMPGLIWVAFGFTSILGLGKSFLSETHNDCIGYLQMAPVPKGAIYLGKLAGNLLLMLFVEMILYPLFMIFFNLDILVKLPTLLIISLLATIGLSALGTLFSALTVQTRAREVMFPLLLLPLSVPVFIGAVESTQGALSGDPYSFYGHWIALLFVFDMILTIASFWMFEFILDY